MLNKFAIPDHQNLPSYDMSTESEETIDKWCPSGVALTCEAPVKSRVSFFEHLQCICLKEKFLKNKLLK